MPDYGPKTLVIEYPSAGKTYRNEKYGVYQYDTYPESSVLAGQERRSFLDDFDTLAEAQKNYPQASWDGEGGCGYRPVFIPVCPPDWFDPANAGESWDGE